MQRAVSFQQMLSVVLVVILSFFFLFFLCYYSVFKKANLWIGGHVIKQSSSFTAEGTADLYISVPQPDRVSRRFLGSSVERI